MTQEEFKKIVLEAFEFDEFLRKKHGPTSKPDEEQTFTEWLEWLERFKEFSDRARS